jgi:glycosyltransferase involved in cell wall biosynthesis
MALADSLGVPLLVTFHGQDATLAREEALKTHRGRELLRKKVRLIARAGAFIAVSDYIRRRLIDDGYPEGKILVHRNGIDLGVFQPLADAAREPVVLFVGRFVEKKGARYLIEAAAELQRIGVVFELVMIGSGPLEAILKRAAAEAGIRCRFPGFLPLEEVKRWLGRARVVAVPSVTAANGDSEGLPTILLEAQAMATPVVATRHSGIPEGVKDGATAELVEERDVAALAQKLRTFLESEAKARAFGLAARDFVIQNFDMRVQVDGLEAIYDRLCRDCRM